MGWDDDLFMALPAEREAPGHLAQFLVGDEQWLSTLRVLRRALVAGAG